MKLNKPNKPNQQSGSILIVSLMILVVLTMIGISSMTSSSLQERMAGNFRDRQIAFQAAEMTLSYAENYAKENINSASVFNGNNGLYAEYTGPTHINAHDSAWWTETGSRVMPTSISQVRTQPRFTMEYRGDIGEQGGTSINVNGYGGSSGGGIVANFRVTVRATGLSDQTSVIVQSNYGKRL